jgi:hypothetical protein
VLSEGIQFCTRNYEKRAGTSPTDFKGRQGASQEARRPDGHFGHREQHQLRLQHENLAFAAGRGGTENTDGQRRRRFFFADELDEKSPLEGIGPLIRVILEGRDWGGFRKMKDCTVAWSC